MDFKDIDEDTKILAIGGGLGSVLVFKVERLAHKEAMSEEDDEKAKPQEVKITECVKVSVDWQSSNPTQICGEDMVSTEFVAFAKSNAILLAAAKGMA